MDNPAQIGNGNEQLGANRVVAIGVLLLKESLDSRQSLDGIHRKQLAHASGQSEVACVKFDKELARPHRPRSELGV